MDARFCLQKAIEMAPSVVSYKQMYLDCFYDHFGSPTDANRQVYKYSVSRKPVIYLYPEKETKVDVELEYTGNLTFTYPEYKGTWSVMAQTNGQLLNLSDSTEHQYLFWEGQNRKSHQSILESKEGFVVKSGEATSFLVNQLKTIGLTPKEYNDFVVYWAPILNENPYNFVHFVLNEEYAEEIAGLNVNPKPDAMLRVFMFYQPMTEYKELKPQVFEPFKRTGFTLVEWGGGEIPLIAD